MQSIEVQETLPSVSLVTDLQNSPSKHVWQAKQKRAFHRLLSGIRRSEMLGGKWVHGSVYNRRKGWHKAVYFSNVYHLTLSSAVGTDWRVINRHWETLRKRWLRAFGRFEYVKVRTTEGNGVLHVVLRFAKRIPHSWLSQSWKDIHGAVVVWVTRLYGSSKAAARYLATQYCSGQAFQRLSMSYGWLGRKAIWNWKHICWVHRGNFTAILEAWSRYLAANVTVPSTLTIDDT